MQTTSYNPDNLSASEIAALTSGPALTFQLGGSMPSNIIPFPVQITARHRPAPVAAVIEVPAIDPACMAQNRAGWDEEDATETAAAIALHTALASVDLGKVKVVSMERHPDGGRKALAKMARGVFKSLRIKGVSVTAPNYSMAQTVEVGLPKRRDYVFEGPESFAHVDSRCAAREENNNAARKIQEILLAAFPNTDNRSDTQSDHFDSCWSLR